MNEEHTALVATLDCVVYPPICADAAAAIRALAGEVERLRGRFSAVHSELCASLVQVDTLRAGFLGNPPKYVMWHEFESMRSEVAAHEEVHADQRRLVRELDVILNGEEGAAKQASLCDIVGQAAAEQRKSSAPLFLELASLRAEVAALRYMVGAIVTQSGGTVAIKRNTLENLIPCDCAIETYDDPSSGNKVVRVAAALADKPRFTDGHGNDISHLIDGPPK